jgi:hypothetical protein
MWIREEILSDGVHESIVYVVTCAHRRISVQIAFDCLKKHSASSYVDSGSARDRTNLL